MATQRPTSSSAARRRQAAMLSAERGWWQEINRAQEAFAACVNRLETARARWDVRITAAMRGVEPRAWWRCNRRIEAGERWYGSSTRARWVQRVVYVTRNRVQELSAERGAHLALLEPACVAAEARLREAVRRPVAAFGIPETARRLGLHEWTVASLVGSRPLRRLDREALCGARDPVGMPDWDPGSGCV